jgi:hypothetical protein
LHGLMRVRCFTQDDAHIFMLPEQITDEIIGVMEMIDHFYRTFGFSYRVELSTKPEKAMGSDEIWDMAISALKKALEMKDIPYRINEGDGAFYGPKIDFHLQDSLGRSWQCGTIQLGICRQFPDQLHLIRLTLFFKKSNRLLVGKLLPNYREIRLFDLVHFFFDQSQILSCKGMLNIEVIIKTVRNSWPNGQFCPGENSFNSLSQQMSGCMPVNRLTLLISKSKEFHLFSGTRRQIEILQISIHPGSQCLFGKFPAQARCHIDPGGPIRNLINTSIFQDYRYHISCCFLVFHFSFPHSIRNKKRPHPSLGDEVFPWFHPD